MLNFELYPELAEQLNEDDKIPQVTLDHLTNWSLPAVNPYVGGKLKKETTVKVTELGRVETKFLRENDEAVHGLARVTSRFLKPENNTSFPAPEIRAGVLVPATLRTSDPELASRLLKPKSWESLKSDIYRSWLTKSPANKLTFYLYSLDPDVFTALGKKLNDLDQKLGWGFSTQRGTPLKEMDGAKRTAFLKMLQQAQKSFFASHIRTNKDWSVVAKMDFNIFSQETDGRKVHKVSVVKAGDDGLHSHRPVNKATTRLNVTQDIESLSMLRAPLQELYNALSVQEFIAYTTTNSPATEVSDAINRPLGVESRRKEFGTKKKISSETTKQLSQAKPEFTPSSVIKVAGSIHSTIDVTVLPTANQDERVALRSDGSIRKPEQPANQEVRGLIPSIPQGFRLASFNQNSSFSVIYGIHYDSPILNTKKIGNVFWYGEEAQFYAAAESYAAWLGDMPSPVYRIYTLKGYGSVGANQSISPNLFNANVGSDAKEIKTKHRGILTSFKQHVKAGLRANPRLLQKYLHIGPEQFEASSLPIEWTPLEGVSTKDFQEYITRARKYLKKTLGLNLGADKQLYTRVVDGKKIKTVKRDTYIINKAGKIVGHKTKDVPIRRFDDVLRLRNKKKRAIWDVKGEGDEWKDYFIQFVLGHRTHQYQQAQTMLVIHVQEIVGSGHKPKKKNLVASKSECVEAMNMAGGGIPMLRNPLGKGNIEDRTRKDINTGRVWTYLSGSMSQAFPYSRMIIPDVKTPEQVDKDNQHLSGLKNKQRKVPGQLKRTERGFEYDGKEFRAFSMFVSMPRSIAEKKFGLIEGKLGRSIFSDLSTMNRYKGKLKRGGHNPMELGLTPNQTRYSPAAGRYGDLDPSLVEPFSISRRIKTVLPKNYFDHEAFGRRWKPIVDSITRKAGDISGIFIAGVENIEKDLQTDKIDKDKYAKIYNTYLKVYNSKVRSLSLQTRSAMLGYMKGLATEVDKNRKNTAGDIGAYDEADDPALEATAHIGNYIGHVKDFLRRGDVLNSDGTLKPIKLPDIGVRVATSSWSADLGHEYHGVASSLKIKAPTSDMAKLFLIYRLLRRSASNPKLGKLADQKFPGTNIRIMASIHSDLLFQWASTDFHVIEDADDPGVKFRQPKRRPLPRGNKFIDRHGGEFAEQKNASLTGFYTGKR